MATSIQKALNFPCTKCGASPKERCVFSKESRVYKDMKQYSHINIVHADRFALSIGRVK